MLKIRVLARFLKRFHVGAHVPIEEKSEALCPKLTEVVCRINDKCHPMVTSLNSQALSILELKARSSIEADPRRCAVVERLFHLNSAALGQDKRSERERVRGQRRQTDRWHVALHN